MPVGKVKWFNVAKGFGFIVPDDGNQDVCVCLESVDAARLPPLVPKIALSYDLIEIGGRKSAANLAVVLPSENIDPVSDFEKEWGLHPS